MKTEWKLPIGGEWRETGKTFCVSDKYHGSAAYSVAAASESEINLAIAKARESLENPLPAHRRYEILMEAAYKVEEFQEELVETLVIEGGKPRKASIREVSRTSETLRWSAEEAKRLHGEAMNLDAAAEGVGRFAITIRSPVGVVCAITPSNSPLNLVAHKVGPALAAGNAVIVKPPVATPVSTLRLCQILYEAGLPGGLLSAVAGDNLGEVLLAHPGFDFYNFTGSIRVGEHLRRTVGLRPSLLELGGNGPVIVHSDADIELAAEACASKGYGAAGQACTSVQRIYVHEDIQETFVAELRKAVGGLKVGDPALADTDVGPMISEAAAERVEGWVSEALASGARAILNCSRDGAMLSPAILTDVLRASRVYCEEVFGPVTLVEGYRVLGEVVRVANSTVYGLHAAVFTGSLDTAFYAIRELQAGGVLVNEATQWRTEFVPFGGIKQSGLGREGPRYAAEAMTNLKVAMIRPGR